MASSQAYGNEWVRFEDKILQPFLAKHAAINAWLDPHCLIISARGGPPAAVAAGIAAININTPGEYFFPQYIVFCTFYMSFSCCCRVIYR